MKNKIYAVRGGVHRIATKKAMGGVDLSTSEVRGNFSPK